MNTIETTKSDTDNTIFLKCTILQITLPNVYYNSASNFISIKVM